MSPVELAALEQATLEARAVPKMRPSETAVRPCASPKVKPEERNLLVKHPLELLVLGDSAEEAVTHFLFREPLELCRHFKTARYAANGLGQARRTLDSGKTERREPAPPAPCGSPGWH